MTHPSDEQKIDEAAEEYAKDYSDGQYNEEACAEAVNGIFKAGVAWARANLIASDDSEMIEWMIENEAIVTKHGKDGVEIKTCSQYRNYYKKSPRDAISSAMKEMEKR